MTREILTCDQMIDLEGEIFRGGFLKHATDLPYSIDERFEKRVMKEFNIIITSVGKHYSPRFWRFNEFCVSFFSFTNIDFEVNHFVFLEFLGKRIVSIRVDPSSFLYLNGFIAKSDYECGIDLVTNKIYECSCNFDDILMRYVSFLDNPITMELKFPLAKALNDDFNSENVFSPNALSQENFFCTISCSYGSFECYNQRKSVNSLSGFGSYSSESGSLSDNDMERINRGYLRSSPYAVNMIIDEIADENDPINRTIKISKSPQVSMNEFAKEEHASYEGSSDCNDIHTLNEFDSALDNISHSVSQREKLVLPDLQNVLDNHNPVGSIVDDEKNAESQHSDLESILQKNELELDNQKETNTHLFSIKPIILMDKNVDESFIRSSGSQSIIQSIDTKGVTDQNNMVSSSLNNFSLLSKNTGESIKEFENNLDSLQTQTSLRNRKQGLSSSIGDSSLLSQNRSNPNVESQNNLDSLQTQTSSRNRKQGLSSNIGDSSLLSQNRSDIDNESQNNLDSLQTQTSSRNRKQGLSSSIGDSSLLSQNRSNLDNESQNNLDSLQTQTSSRNRKQGLSSNIGDSSLLSQNRSNSQCRITKQS